MNTRRLLGTALLLCLPLCHTGCVTAAMWEGYGDTLHAPGGDGSAVRLVRAARSSQGQHRVEVDYGRGSYTFTFWPQDVAEPGASRWNLPALEPARRDMPEGLEPGWIEVGVEDGEGWPAEGASCPELEASRPPRIVFRLREQVLEFREGHEEFRPLATLPSLSSLPAGAGPSAGDVALGALVVVATPVTFALDLSLGGLLFALALV